MWMMRLPDLDAARPACPALDRGGGVLALLGGEALGFGQVGAEPGVLLLEGGDEPGRAVPPGLLSFGVCLGHSGWPAFRYVTNVP